MTAEQAEGGAPFTFTTTEVAPNGQLVHRTQSPMEIASWYFPEETEEHEAARNGLAADIERLIERALGVKP